MLKLLFLLSAASALRTYDDDQDENDQMVDVAAILQGKAGKIKGSASKIHDFVLGLAEKSIAGIDVAPSFVEKASGVKSNAASPSPPVGTDPITYTPGEISDPPPVGTTVSPMSIHDDPMQAAIETIRQFIEDLYQHSLSTHAANQRAANQASEAISGCAGDSEATRNQAEKVRGLAGTRRGEHNRCRRRQVDVTRIMAHKCDDYDSFRKSSTVEQDLACVTTSFGYHSSDDEVQRKTFESCLSSSWPTLTKLEGYYRECAKWMGIAEAQDDGADVPDSPGSPDRFDNISNVHTLKRLCDNIQSDFENMWCGYGSKLDDAIEEENACRNRTALERENTHSSIKFVNAAHIADHIAAQRTLCLLDIFALPDAEKPPAVAKCLHVVVDTKMFNMLYPGIPDKPTRTRATKTCIASWLSDEYYGQDWYGGEYYGQERYGFSKVENRACQECNY